MDMLRQADFTVGPLLATFLLGFTTIVFLFWYSSRKQSYWKKRGIPYVKPIPLLGSFTGGMNEPLHVTDMDRMKKYGRIYGYFEGNRPILSVAEPEILRNIFVKDFQVFNGRRDLNMGDKLIENMLSVMRGENWKRVRTIVSPTFTTGKIKRMMSIFNDCSETVVKNFSEASEKGEPVDAKSIYNAFSMDVIASVAFSTKIDSHNDPNNEFVTTAKQIFSKKGNWRILLFLIFPGITKLFKVNIFSPKPLKFFADVILQIMEERKRTGQTRNDFLQLLMDTANDAADEGKLDVNEKDDIAENYGKVDSNQVFKGPVSKKTLSHEELVAQCVSFFLAGSDNTNAVLSFASYALALHPEIQERLIQEMDEALNANDGEMTYEAVQSMKYLDNVIAETMRLYTTVVRLERLADADYKLGNTGVTVPKDMIVTIPIYVMHRDPELFPDPEKFDPDRFSPEERAKQIPYSYLPFGAGPRNCIAMRFALMEIKVCLANVLSNFRIKKCSTTKVPLEFDFRMGLLQPKSISLYMEARKDSVKANPKNKTSVR